MKDKRWVCGGRGEAVYGLGILGAVIYFFQQATTGSDYIIGFFKAIFWPAFVVYRALGLLNL